MRLYLGAVVPNEGARRFAAWLNAVSSAHAAKALGAIGVDAMHVDRMITGELVPGQRQRFDIARATGHAVLVRDWSQPAFGRWGDPVPARRMRRAA
ncbi:hypothetical protein [Sphingomonas sp. CFBP 13720]|uniref:hypothetical protein n=1 Tax=Sphingomonas sp. CFBP 13720 TaxID=2775302 RepID=UPI00177ED574|nr:hypothetical protein [Sphingomonas sp. CFBP 13720]MBD8677946.1 hypothetical protein [Sphingomonas sp. CFBP 13720]